MIAHPRGKNTRMQSFPVFDLATGKQSDVEVVCGCKCTDVGNAQRLVALYGDDIHYCAAQKEWYIWDGKRWTLDTTKRIYEMAKDAVQLIHAEASFVDEEDRRHDKQQELTKWAFASESQFRIKAMVDLATSDPRIAITPEQFDTDGWLINCPNGTLDVHKRTLRKHRREDCITKLTAVPYEPSAESELWYKTLLDVLSLDEGAFLQRAAGSALTTANKDKALFYLYGGPNSRKSTLLDPIFATLGDYGEPFDISMLAKAPQRPGGARPDIVKLDGVRAAQCSEVPKGMVFNDALVKSLTSGNPKSARGLFEKRERKIKPVTKLFIEGNHLPRIDFDDEATFNRFHILTFLKSLDPDKVDTSIRETLLTDPEAQKAIFAWIVAGCYLWQEVGLAPPESVNAARKAYQKTMNPLTSFVEMECIRDEMAQTLTSTLWERFTLYRGSEAVHLVPNIRSFGSYLKQFGFDKRHTSNGNVWAGIRLRGVGEFNEDADEDERRLARNGDDVNSVTDNVHTFPCNVALYMETLQKSVTTIHLFTTLEGAGDDGRSEFEKDLDEFVDMVNAWDDSEYEHASGGRDAV